MLCSASAHYGAIVVGSGFGGARDLYPRWEEWLASTERFYATGVFDTASDWAVGRLRWDRMTPNQHPAAPGDQPDDVQPTSSANE